jgi:hypothetical protein
VQFNLQIKMTNSEMRTPEALVEALADVARDLVTHRNVGRVLDVNGNTVGRFEVIGDDEREADKALVSREELEDLKAAIAGRSTVTADAMVGKLIEGIKS